ncbi:uncharacterized protein LOC129741031 [Uranotaenia lowii]|uniref:uncharacterized protein LOC129741031 n=1 Tax=Uranotaenia lowii TaxID=190385 RepID=UPI00247999BE|nr:uncharacterized protein LOC129741031 [Uranotaenia lowii]
MHKLTEFEKPLYSRVPEHPGVWKSQCYRPEPIRAAFDSSDPHLLDQHCFKNLFLETPHELHLSQQPHSESYADFVSRMAEIKGERYRNVYREMFEGKDLGTECLKQEKINARSTTYRRDHCQSNRSVNSIDIRRQNIRAGKYNFSVPEGWTFRETSSASAHRSWSEFAALLKAIECNSTSDTPILNNF